MITVADLDAHHGLIIGTHQDMVEGRKYVLKVGAVGDWAIYYGPSGMEYSDIMTGGPKLTDPKKMRALFEMDDEAFKRFRP